MINARMMSWYSYGFRPYVSVAERRRKAASQMAKLAKKGKVIQPVQIEGRTIARTFWGKAWCDNLESYMDYENRLPRGRTYVRNGSVVHLDIRPGEIEATVSGSQLYQVRINIAAAAKARWNKVCSECAGGIGSLVELLQGRFSDHVMGILTRKDTGLFPTPAEIQLKCSCPDWATMCKHVAAVLYGVGARLDQRPELLFTLRSVNHEELITQAATVTDLAGKTAAGGAELEESELGTVFGIELDTESAPAKPAPAASAAAAPAKPPRKTRKPTPASKRAGAKRKPRKKAVIPSRKRSS
jgi:uncharacterized Zn finger protein